MKWVRAYVSFRFALLRCASGLGKTIQVISFFAHLKEKGGLGPHLVVVPCVLCCVYCLVLLTSRFRSSTLENWCREFARFAPSISIQTYYAGKEERSALRQTLVETQRRHSKSGAGWEVLITTYQLAQGDERDRKFFRRIEWDVSSDVLDSLPTVIEPFLFAEHRFRRGSFPEKLSVTAVSGVIEVRGQVASSPYRYPATK